MRGLHLLGEWRDCRSGRNEMADAQALRRLCTTHAAAAGLTVVGEQFHQFSPQGATGALLLAESHLAVHTWPELNAVTADLYVCNFQQDNSALARQVFAGLRSAFAPQDPLDREVWRGTAIQSEPPTLVEWLNQDYGSFVKPGKQLASTRTRYQQLEVWETPAFGKLFRLDGSFMSSEADEFFYHENLVHLPAISHPEPKTALIIGGGDGGSADELLKHPSIESVRIVEIDPAVLAMAKEHFRAIHHGALEHPKVQVIVADGLAYVREDRDQYDLLVLDLTDPGGPSRPLYTPEFYAACAARLKPGGAMTLHIGAPFAQRERFARSLRELAGAFRLVLPYLVAVPLYGALWGFACASQDLDPRSIAAATIEERLQRRRIGGLQYYNAQTHGAMLALPGFVRALLAS